MEQITRSFRTASDMASDTLTMMQRHVSAAVNDRETAQYPPELNAVVETARYLADLEVDDPIEDHRRRQALSFLTQSLGSFVSPWFEGGARSAMHVLRDESMTAYGVEIVRTDGQQLTANDARIAWRALREEDGQTRMMGHGFNERIAGVAQDSESFGGSVEAMKRLEMQSMEASERLRGDERYRRIAEWCRKADKEGLSRNRYVAQREGVGTDYARQLVARAKKRGLLE